jgi:hypothetical protein
LALSRAFLSAGVRSAARIAMMATTTKSSMRVKLIEVRDTLLRQGCGGQARLETRDKEAERIRHWQCLPLAEADWIRHSCSRE